MLNYQGNIYDLGVPPWIGHLHMSKPIGTILVAHPT